MYHYLHSKAQIWTRQRLKGKDASSYDCTNPSINMQHLFWKQICSLRKAYVSIQRRVLQEKLGS